MQSDLDVSLLGRDASSLISVPTVSRSIDRGHRPADICAISLAPEQQYQLAAAVQIDQQSHASLSPADAFSELACAYGVSFDYPQACDSATLSALTPLSGSCSPPMSSISSKTMHNHHHHHQQQQQQHHHHHHQQHAGFGTPQQPTPPSSSKLYWSNQYNIHAATTAQSSPSLGAPVSVPVGVGIKPDTGFDAMSPYMTGASHLDDLPSTASYYSQYPVPPIKPHATAEKPYSHHAHHSSHGPQSQAQSQPGSQSTYSYPSMTPNLDLIIPQTSQPHGQQQQHSLVSMATPTRPANFYATATATATTPSPKPRNMQAASGPSSSAYRVKKPLSASTTVSSGSSSSKAKGRTGGRAAGKQSNSQRRAQALENHEIEPLMFKPNVPQEERFLLELRRKYDGLKGKTMWEHIGEEFGKRFSQYQQKPCLQMRLTRAKTKWLEWPERELHLLHQAYMEIENERYNMIRQRFEQLGGGLYMTWNPSNIEAKLVELGLENMYFNGDSTVRSRLKVPEPTKAGRGGPMSAAAANARENGMAGAPESLLMMDGSCYRPGQQQFSDVQVDGLLSQIETARGSEAFMTDCDME